jgi:hypothetical protein
MTNIVYKLPPPIFLNLDIFQTCIFIVLNGGGGLKRQILKKAEKKYKNNGFVLSNPFLYETEIHNSVS